MKRLVVVVAVLLAVVAFISSYTATAYAYDETDMGPTAEAPPRP